MKRTVLFSLAFCLAFFCLLTGCKDKELNGPAIPFVKTNDFVFVYDGESKAKSELPDNYTVIGEVEKTSSIPDEAKNGESSCCKPGRKFISPPKIPTRYMFIQRCFQATANTVI